MNATTALVLLVGDGEWSDRAAAALSTAPDVSTVRATTPDATRAVLDERPVDCVVVTAPSHGSDGVVPPGVRTATPTAPIVLAPEESDERLAARAVGAGVADYVPPGDREELPARVRQAIESGGGRPASSDPAPESPVADGSGPEDSVDPQSATRDREKLFDALPAAFPDSVYVYDRDGEYLDAMLGWRQKPLTSRADLIGRTVDDVFPAETARRLREAIETTLASNALKTVEYPLSSDGETHWFEGTLTPVEGEYRGRPAVLLTARDVTERKRYERRIESQNRRLERLASVISHDLKTPVAAASKLLALLRADLADDTSGDVDRALDELSTIVDRLDRFADTLPTLAAESIDAEETADCDLAQVARRAWAAVDTGDLTLSVDDLPTVAGDPNRLGQAFQNLFENVVDHATGDGVAPAAAATTVTVASLSDAEGFYVADDGPGVDPDDDLFGFGVGDGSGMGLAIVRTVVEAHGWTVTVTRSDDGGARFEVGTAVPFPSRFE